MSTETRLLEDLAASVKNAIVGGPFGSNLVSNDYVESGVPVIRGQNMGEKWVSGEFVFVSHDKAEQLAQNKARPGDLIFTQRGTLGQVAIVPKLPYAEYIVSQSQMKITLDPAKADASFVYYLFRSEEQLRYIQNAAIRTGVPHTNLGILRKTPVTIPPLADQTIVAQTLSALDDRIALLRETNATLEAIAQTLFKSWFVDFDPVHARARGERPERLSDAVAALFPNSLEESSLGLVPRGWEIGQLQDLLVLQRGFDLPASARTDGDFPLITASGPSGTHKISMAKAPGVVTGRSGVLGKVFLVLEDYWPLNTTLWIKEFKRATACYAYELLKRLDFLSFNAGSAVPTLNRNHIHGLKYVLPSAEAIQAFENVALPLHQSVMENMKQAQTLATIRDTLLPRLISGKLRMPDSKQDIGESS